MTVEERTAEVLRSGRFDRITIRQARALIDSTVNLDRTPVSVGYYFGTWRNAGHYTWREGMEKTRYGSDEPMPWKRVDGQLTPKGDREGECLIHYLDGWTAIAFVNRTDDSRPGSNSAFFFDQRLSFAEAVAEARKRFPEVMDRLAFDLVEVER